MQKSSREAVGRTSARAKKNYSFYRISFRWGTLPRNEAANLRIKRAKEANHPELKAQIIAETLRDTRVPAEVLDWMERYVVPQYDPDDKNTRHWKYCIRPCGLTGLIAMLEAILEEDRPHNVEIRDPLGNIVYRCTKNVHWRTHAKEYNESVLHPVRVSVISENARAWNVILANAVREALIQTSK